eukprot:264486-Rhodomonas_salina.1
MASETEYTAKSNTRKHNRRCRPHRAMPSKAVGAGCSTMGGISVALGQRRSRSQSVSWKSRHAPPRKPTPPVCLSSASRAHPSRLLPTAPLGRTRQTGCRKTHRARSGPQRYGST